MKTQKQRLKITTLLEDVRSMIEEQIRITEEYLTEARIAYAEGEYRDASLRVSIKESETHLDSLRERRLNFLSTEEMEELLEKQ